MSIDRPKISIVSYLNSKPFIYGFDKSNFSKLADISLDIPSVCAEKLINGSVDIGLVPVAILPELKNYKIISDYCIGANGAVDSVLILSDVPLEEIEDLLLDYQSRTSVMLSKVLLENHWKKKVKFIPAQIGYENSIGGKTAGVVIGDRALILRKKFKYVYDLPLEWKKMTGLPFVFATWTSTIDLSAEFINSFNKAIEEGMKMIDEISKKEFTPEISQEEVFTYLTKSIDFDFNQEKQEALELFLKLASKVSDI